jgi:integrase
MAAPRTKKAAPAKAKKRSTTRLPEGVFWRTTSDGTRELWIRVVYTHPDTGKRHDMQRRVRSNRINDAKRARRALQAEADEIRSGARAADAPRTFGEVLDRYERERMKPPPVNPDGSRRTRTGYKSERSLGTHRAHLEKLRAALGRVKLTQLTPARLESFRIERLNTPVMIRRKDPRTGEIIEVERDRPRTVTTVNREMSFLRRVVKFAIASFWLPFNPFETTTLLDKGAEKEAQRKRVLSYEEEARLLAACDNEERGHLRPIIIAAVETGMRRGEILSLEWRNVDLARSIITLTPSMTKSSTGRVVPISPTLHAELAKLKKARHGKQRVFTDHDYIARSFRTAARVAGLADLHFHDLRHTAATRLAGRVTDLELQKMLGHTTARMSAVYVTTDAEMIARATRALAESRQSATTAETVN